MSSAESQTLETLLAALAAVPALRAEMEELRLKTVKLQAEVDALKAAKRKDKWMTLKEAAEALRMSEKTVTRLIERGRLQRNEEHWRVRVLAASVEAYAGKVTLPLAR